MEALIVRKLGDPTAATVTDENSPVILSKNSPVPELKSPTAVRVRVRATSLNYANYLQILGKYQEKAPLPFIPGSDYSGVVEAVGPRVSKFKIGDSVCSLADLGSFAQFVVADESQLFKVPEGCDLVDAAALPVAFGTSHVGLVHRAQLKPGQVLLVLGAAGGVGASAVQIGKVRGAIVIAVARIHCPSVLEDSLQELLSWLARGVISINISHRYSLSEANLAFSAIKDRKVIGKVMITFDDHKAPRAKL